jgi:hypothetical protein
MLSSPASPRAAVGSTIILQRSPRNFIHLMSYSSVTWMMLSTLSVIILRVRWPICGVLAPSAIVVWFWTLTIFYCYTDIAASCPASGSTPIILQLGYNYLVTNEQPDMRPPPPILAKK